METRDGNCASLKLIFLMPNLVLKTSIEHKFYARINLKFKSLQSLHNNLFIYLPSPIAKKPTR